MQAELNKRRTEIDNIDNRIINLIAKRLELVGSIVEDKNKQGIPVLDQERERQLLAARKAYAQKKGINLELIQDLFQRCIQESYAYKNKQGFKQVNSEIRKIVIVGGKGRLGKLFERYLSLSGYAVYCLDRDDWHQATEIMGEADVVIVAVPIDFTVEIIKKLKPYLTPNMLMLDLTSIKKVPLETMLDIHQGAVIGLHPMFGPDVENLSRQVIVNCGGRYLERADWFLQQCKIWGVELVEISAQDHDHYMGYIQVLRHFSTYVNGVHLSKQNINLTKMLELSSPIYHLELLMVGRLFAQQPDLYADIIMNNSEHLKLIESLLNEYNLQFNNIKNKNKANFIKDFNKTGNWFSKYAGKFLSESRKLLNYLHRFKNI